MDKRLEEIRESIKEIMETPYVARREKAEKVGIDLVMTGKVDYLIQEVDLLNDQNQRYEQITKDLRNLCDDYRNGFVGEITDSFLVDRVIEALKGESNG